MSKKSGISSLVAAHYPSRTADGRTIARSEPPGVAVLQEDGKVVLRRDDESPRSSFEEFMTTTATTPLTSSMCVICDMPITAQQPSDGPVPHGKGVAHESCNNAFTDNLLTEHPPRGHRPRPRGQH